MFKNIDFRILQKPSIIFIIFCTCFAYWFSDLWMPWHIGVGHKDENRNTPFTWDVAQYYSYLPAAFVNGFTFENDNAADGYLYPAQLGGNLPKTTYGMALMYSPFFAIGYKIAKNTKAPLDGYSDSFAQTIHWGSIFYGLLGLLFLRNLLVKFFSERVIALTLAIIFFGTNLFCYILSASEMTHGYLFMLISAIMLVTYSWYQQVTFPKTILLGFLLGLCVLIRPTEIVVGFIFALWMVDGFNAFKERCAFLLRHYLHILVMLAIAILLWIPQFMLWKYKTGHYFYFSYPGEQFFWGDPQIINVLFSYRKGWFVYTPLILLAFMGFFFMRDEVKKLRPLFCTLILFIIYLLSCWWDWCFGGSFGARGFTQYYSFLAIPIAALTAHVSEHIKKIRLQPLLQTAFLVIIFSGICLNVGQTYQYSQGMIHNNGMNKQTYWYVFRKYHLSGMQAGAYWGMVKELDYDKLKSGEKRDQ
jgi:hypothetical protein